MSSYAEDLLSLIPGYDSLWSLAGKPDNVTAQEWMTQGLMDAIIRYPSLKTVYETVMLGSSAAQVIRNHSLGGGNAQYKAGSFSTNDALAIPGMAMGLIDVALVVNATAAASLSAVGLQDIWEKTLMEPNIEGIPISTAVVTTDRSIDIGEQVMIVQESSQKQYWTDNAVPKLKEWTIDGYITTALELDSLFMIRPSLDMQLSFLDTCASSRRPVLFKDNRGRFRFVQIMNLQTTEEASYNNAIKVNISLKEYKPYTVQNVSVPVGVAPKVGI